VASLSKGSHFGGSQLEVSNLMLSIYFGFKVSLEYFAFTLEEWHPWILVWPVWPWFRPKVLVSFLYTITPNFCIYFLFFLNSLDYNFLKITYKLPPLLSHYISNPSVTLMFLRHSQPNLNPTCSIRLNYNAITLVKL